MDKKRKKGKLEGKIRSLSFGHRRGEIIRSKIIQPGPHFNFHPSWAEMETCRRKVWHTMIIKLHILPINFHSTFHFITVKRKKEEYFSFHFPFTCKPNNGKRNNFSPFLFFFPSYFQIHIIKEYFIFLYSFLFLFCPSVSTKQVDSRLSVSSIGKLVKSLMVE